MIHFLTQTKFMGRIYFWVRIFRGKAKTREVTEIHRGENGREGNYGIDGDQ